MNLEDNTNDIVGHFRIELRKDDGTVEVFEEKNLIMDTARENMANLVGGYSLGSPINKFVLGTKGHIGTDVLTFKPVGSYGFDSTRTELFSEESLDYTYQIDFDTVSSNDIETDTLAIGEMQGSGITSLCSVTRTIFERSVKFEITIPAEAGNPIDGSNAIGYTEAGLYADDLLFSQKTLSVIAKDETSEIYVSWKIIF